MQGLTVSFHRLLMMRQAHGFAFGKSDMFLLCAAKLDASTPKDDTGRPVAVACEKVQHYPHSYFAWHCIRAAHRACPQHFSNTCACDRVTSHRKRPCELRAVV